MDLVLEILKQPVAAGALVMALLKWLQGVGAALDKEGKLKAYGPQLHVAFLVLTFLGTLAEAGATGHLGQFDLTSLGQFLNYWIYVLVGGKAMGAASEVKWQDQLNKVMSSPEKK